MGAPWVEDYEDRYRFHCKWDWLIDRLFLLLFVIMMLCIIIGIWSEIFAAVIFVGYLIIMGICFVFMS